MGLSTFERTNFSFYYIWLVTHSAQNEPSYKKINMKQRSNFDE
ncbi:hypothetical protein J45TS6_37840 [Paenibacillus sp. J45TS6]|nr:hypothetical protein J45TS6_37840 [Paenibacillus sp. J45TS6]